MVSNVTECEVYEMARTPRLGSFWAQRQRAEYFIDHTFYPDKNYLTWTLDYSKESDLDDSVGFWYVQPFRRNQGGHDFYYSVDVQLKGWCWLIENMITKSGLSKATSWVNERKSQTLILPLSVMLSIMVAPKARSFHDPVYLSYCLCFLVVTHMGPYNVRGHRCL